MDPLPDLHTLTQAEMLLLLSEKNKVSKGKDLRESKGRFQQLDSDDETPVDLKSTEDEIEKKEKEKVANQNQNRAMSDRMGSMRSDEKVGKGKDEIEIKSNLSGPSSRSNSTSTSTSTSATGDEDENQSDSTKLNRSQKRRSEKEKLKEERKNQKEEERNSYVRERGFIRSKVKLKSGKLEEGEEEDDPESDENKSKDKDKDKDKEEIQENEIDEKNKKDKKVKFESQEELKEGVGKTSKFRPTETPISNKWKGKEKTFKSIFESKDSPFKGISSNFNSSKKSESNVKNVGNLYPPPVPIDNPVKEKPPVSSNSIFSNETSSLKGVFSSTKKNKENKKKDVENDEIDENPGLNLGVGHHKDESVGKLNMDGKKSFIREELNYLSDFPKSFDKKETKDITEESFDVEKDLNERLDKENWFKDFEKKSLIKKDVDIDDDDDDLIKKAKSDSIQSNIIEEKRNSRVEALDEKKKGLILNPEEVLSETERDLKGRPRGRSLCRTSVVSIPGSTGQSNETFSSVGNFGTNTIRSNYILESKKDEKEKDSKLEIEEDQDQSTVKLSLNSLEKVGDDEKIDSGIKLEEVKDSSDVGESSKLDLKNAEEKHEGSDSKVEEISSGLSQNSNRNPNEVKGEGEEDLSLAPKQEELRTSVKAVGSLSNDTQALKDSVNPSTQDSSYIDLSILGAESYLSAQEDLDRSISLLLSSPDTKSRTCNVTYPKDSMGLDRFEMMPSDTVERRMSLGTLPNLEMGTILESDFEWKNCLGSGKSGRSSVLGLNSISKDFDGDVDGDGIGIEKRRTKSSDGRVEGSDQSQDQSFSSFFIEKSDPSVQDSQEKDLNLEVKDSLYQKKEIEELHEVSKIYALASESGSGSQFNFNSDQLDNQSNKDICNPFKILEHSTKSENINKDNDDDEKKKISKVRFRSISSKSDSKDQLSDEIKSPEKNKDLKEIRGNEDPFVALSKLSSEGGRVIASFPKSSPSKNQDYKPSSSLNPPSPNLENQKLMSKIASEHQIKGREDVNESNLAQGSETSNLRNDRQDQDNDQKVKERQRIMRLAGAAARMYSSDNWIDEGSNKDSDLDTEIEEMDEDSEDMKSTESLVSSTNAIENGRTSPSRDISIDSEIIDRNISLENQIRGGVGIDSEIDDDDVNEREESFFDPTRDEPRHFGFEDIQSKHQTVNVNQSEIGGEEEGETESGIEDQESENERNDEYEASIESDDYESEEDGFNQDSQFLKYQRSRNLSGNPEGFGMKRGESQFSLTETTPSNSPQQKRVPLQNPSTLRNERNKRSDSDGRNQQDTVAASDSDNSEDDHFQALLQPREHERSIRDNRDREGNWPSYSGLFNSKVELDTFSDVEELDSQWPISENQLGIRSDDVFQDSNNFQMSSFENQGERIEKIANVSESETARQSQEVGEEQGGKVKLSSSLQKIKDRLSTQGVLSTSTYYERLKSNREKNSKFGGNGRNNYKENEEKENQLSLELERKSNKESQVSFLKESLGKGSKLEPFRKQKNLPMILDSKELKSRNLIVGNSKPSFEMRKIYNEKKEIEDQRFREERDELLSEESKRLRKEILRSREVKEREEGIRMKKQGNRIDFQAPVSKHREGSDSHHNISRTQRAKNLKARSRLASDSIYRPGAQLAKNSIYSPLEDREEGEANQQESIQNFDEDEDEMEDKLEPKFQEVDEFDVDENVNVDVEELD